MFTTLLNFCSNDLSAFYFDIRKDCIYCDTKNNEKRRAARTVLNTLFEYLVRWFAPFLVFTCEEAWGARQNKSSIHEQEFINVSAKFKKIELKNKWDFIKEVRKRITGAIEIKRSEKVIGSSLQAKAEIWISKKDEKKIEDIDMAEISIVSSFILNILDRDDEEIKVNISLADGKKCKRCWKILQEVEEICKRCEDVIKA